GPPRPKVRLDRPPRYLTDRLLGSIPCAGLNQFGGPSRLFREFYDRSRTRLSFHKAAPRGRPPPGPTETLEEWEKRQPEILKCGRCSKLIATGSFQRNYSLKRWTGCADLETGIPRPQSGHPDFSE